MPTAYTTLLSTSKVVPQWQGKRTFVLQGNFDLTGLTAMTNGDSVNLFTVPAKTAVLNATLEITTAGTSATTGTQTYALRLGTTALTTALDGKTGGGMTTTGMTAGTSLVSKDDAVLNVLAAVATDVVTANPKIKVTAVCVDCS